MLVSDIKVLSAGDIATALDRTEELYDVPEWGGAVKLRPLSMADRDEIIKQATVDGTLDGQKIAMLLIVRGVVEPILTEAILQERAFAVVDRLSRKMMDLNGRGKEAALTASRTF